MCLEACGPDGFAVAGPGFDPDRLPVAGADLVAGPDDLKGRLDHRLWLQQVSVLGVEHLAAVSRVRRPGLLAVAVADAVAAASVLCRLTVKLGRL